MGSDMALGPFQVVREVCGGMASTIRFKYGPRPILNGQGCRVRFGIYESSNV